METVKEAAMSSTMALWDYVPSYSPADHLRPIGGKPAPFTCERCGRTITPSRHWGQEKRFCSELCRKRAERARWKARWKARGVNKYIGGGAK